ncbi:MAG: TIGR01777 family oxidoreductase [Bacteroidota bacterium]
MAAQVLITGGSGFIGKKLTAFLQQAGYSVVWLSRHPEKDTFKGVRSFAWNPEKGEMDPEALKDTDAVIHLAGTNIGAARWTSKRKKEIIDSRVNAAKTLYEYAKRTGKLSTIIAASATGLYGSGGPGMVFTEISPRGTGFQAEATAAWEQALDNLRSIPQRFIKFRFSNVWGMEGGALPEMIKPVKLHVGALGSGQQVISWIHIDDLCRAILFALQSPELAGTYNLAAPEPGNYDSFVKQASDILHAGIWLPRLPAFLLRIGLGEMADLLIEGAYVSCERIRSAGFKFNYPTMRAALRNLLAAEDETSS